MCGQLPTLWHMYVYGTMQAIRMCLWLPFTYVSALVTPTPTTQICFAVCVAPRRPDHMLSGLQYTVGATHMQARSVLADNPFRRPGHLVLASCGSTRDICLQQ